MATPTTQPTRAESSSRVPEPPSGGHSLDAEKVAVRAYELYCARGCENGRDIDDWIDAERQLRDEETSESKDA